MLLINWLRTIAERYHETRSTGRSRHRPARQHRRSAVGHRFLAAQSVETLEDRILLALDFGDAPDTGVGTGSGNYKTLASDNGPSHTIVAGLFLGATVDGDNGTLQNTAARNGPWFGCVGRDHLGALHS